MLLHPDAATLVLTAALITPLIAAADYFLWRQTRETALAWWGGGALAMTVGTMTLFGGSDRTPYAELGTLSLLLSFWLFLRGIHVFQHPADRRVRPLYRYFVFASVLILLAVALTQPPLLNRSVAALLVGLVAGHSAFLLVLRHRGEAAASSRFTGAIFALSAALHLACGLLALLTDVQAVNWALLHAANILLLIGWNFGFLMLIGQRNQERISELANYDELTGVHSRRAFMAMARQLFSVVERQQQAFAVLMLDVDHFKQVNDSYGHAGGDEILKRFTANCTACLRHSDLLGRIGGEEFCIVLPDTGSDGAAEVAERIRAGFEAGDSFWHGDRLRATVSIGVAARGVDAATLEGLMACADEALYQAKNEGRNRVARLGDGSAAPAVKLVWDGRYRSGHEGIDSEHQYLFTWANTLLRKLQANANSPVIAADLRELLHWLSAHFRNEERILAELGWAGLERHVLQHRALEARGEALLAEVKSGDRKCAELLDFIVLEVVARHLARHDAEYFASLKFNASAA